VPSDIAENITGQDWYDFHLTLNDLTPGVNHNNPGGGHPAFPHFHTGLLGANATFAPLVLVSQPESQPVIDLGLGSPVINGGSEDMRDFVIHEWENENGEPNDILRRFELVEQPTVPESDTIAQVGIGIPGLVTCAFRRYIPPHRATMINSQGN
jgi:hypothetical protein